MGIKIASEELTIRMEDFGYYVICYTYSSHSECDKEFVTKCNLGTKESNSS